MQNLINSTDTGMTDDPDQTASRAKALKELGVDKK